MKVAIFDFDGTLLRGNSYHLFFQWQLQHRPGRAPALLGWALLRRARLVPARFLKNRALQMLRGRPAAEVSELGRRLYAGLLAPRLRPAGLQELVQRRAEGCEILLLTGAFDFLAAPLAEAQGISLWRATRVRFQNGACAGIIDGAEMAGAAKLRALEDLLAGRTVDWPRSWAYGDEESDGVVLSRVGQPVWIKTRRKTPRGLPPACRVVQWEA
ncbi:MAG TPA: HAD-IB family hydrolase [Opitutaceae bacterium]|nr:HAD-IB family hydrolase [Opitutaceae bacterium]